MRKIDMILDGREDHYVKLLTAILEPFALFAVGKVPVYAGEEVDGLGLNCDKSSNEVIFIINDEGKASVNLEKMEATVFGSETFSLSEEDNKTVSRLVDILKKSKSKNVDNDIPKDLRSALAAIAAFAELRRKDRNF